MALLPFRLEHFALDYRSTKSEVLAMVTVSVGVLWNVTSCILVKFYGLSGEGEPFAQFTFPEFRSLCTRSLDSFTVFSNTLPCYEPQPLWRHDARDPTLLISTTVSPLLPYPYNLRLSLSFSGLTVPNYYANRRQGGPG